MNDPSNTASKSNGVTSITKQTTNLLEILPDLQGGVFLSQIEQALTDAALNICVHGEKGKKAKVTVEFDLSRIGESNQVAVAHTVSFTYPTRRGKKSETATTETPLPVLPGLWLHRANRRARQQERAPLRAPWVSS